MVLALSPIAFAFLASAARAEDTFVCNGWTASVGMRAFEVHARCGGPHHREKLRVPVRARAADGFTDVSYGEIEHWTYGRESDRVRTVLTFEQYTLKRIRVLRRGEAAPIL